MRGLVIIGGGAAGIGAALEARSGGIDALILEAMERLGGRAHSIDWKGHKLDLGCTWMHSAERNSLRVEAERIGAAIDRRPTKWFEQFRELGFSREEQEQVWTAFGRLEARMRKDPPASDRAGDALEPDDPWRSMLNALSGYINGAPLDEVSVSDWLAYDNAASDQNLRLPGGYGGLLTRLASDLDYRLGAAVTAVSRLSGAVRVTLADSVVEAERVLVTVPTSTLHRIRFDPPVEGLFDAAEQLPLGFADKMFLALEHAEEFPDDAHLIGNPRSSETGSYFIRPMGIPVIEGFFGGSGAVSLEQLGDEDASAFAIEELEALLGSGIRNRLSLIAFSRWGREPWIGGAYSHALPRRSDARARLASAGDERISFAGEAVSTSDYSTAHGAFDSGRAAVRRLFR